MTVSPILQHLLISLAAWLSGLLLGGLAGYLGAIVIGFGFGKLPWLRYLFILFPWRTLVFNLLAFIWLFLGRRVVIINLFQLVSISLAATLSDLGQLLDLILVSLFMTLLTFSLTLILFLKYWHLSALLVRLTAGARTLAILTGMMVAAFGYLSGVGFGGQLAQQLGMLNVEAAFSNWLLLISTFLAVDLVLGVVQLGIALVSEGRRKETPQVVEAR